MPCSAGGFSRIQPATTVFFSHAKSAQPPANQPANSIFLSREISQPSSQPASRTSPKFYHTEPIFLQNTTVS